MTIYEHIRIRQQILIKSCVFNVTFIYYL